MSPAQANLQAFHIIKTPGFKKIVVLAIACTISQKW